MGNEIKTQEEQETMSKIEAKAKMKQERLEKQLVGEFNDVPTLEQGTLPTSADDEWDIAQENQAISQYEKYRLWPDLAKIIFQGKTTKVAGYGRTEDIVLRVKIGSWVKDIRLSPQDKEYLLYKGVGKDYDGKIGAYIGNKSGKNYYGIRFELGNNRVLNYAFTIGDFSILTDMKYAKVVTQS